MKEEIYDKKQAADYLKISERTIDYLRAAGQIACFKIGRLVRFRQEDLEEFARQQVTATMTKKNPHA